jgi:aldehyde dehydrogenase (NAD+)
MNQAVTIPAAKGVFIDNAWRPAASGRSIPVIAPAEGAVFASIAAGDKEDIDLAVAAARRSTRSSAGVCWASSGVLSRTTSTN